MKQLLASIFLIFVCSCQAQTFEIVKVQQNPYRTEWLQVFLYWKNGAERVTAKDIDNIYTAIQPYEAKEIFIYQTFHKDKISKDRVLGSFLKTPNKRKLAKQLNKSLFYKGKRESGGTSTFYEGTINGKHYSGTIITY